VETRLLRDFCGRQGPEVRTDERSEDRPQAHLPTPTSYKKKGEPFGSLLTLPPFSWIPSRARTASAS